MLNQTYINVSDVIDNPSALTQEQGNIIYRKIVDSVEKGNAVILDFQQVESMISPFLNNSIGQLYGKYTSKQIEEFLDIRNFPKEKVSTLNIVIANAKRFYKNKQYFNSKVEEIINS